MPSEGPRSDADEGELSLDLVQRIQAGDTGAWDRLYARYHDRLLLAIRCRLGPRLRAVIQSEDVLQSVLADALTDLHAFAPRGKGSLGHWLHACVLNKLRSQAAHYGANFRAAVEPVAPSEIERHADLAAKTPEYFESGYGALEKALADLDESMREVVVLRAVEGLSNTEAAEHLGRSAEATSKLYNRALARLATRVDARLLA